MKIKMLLLVIIVALAFTGTAVAERSGKGIYLFIYLLVGDINPVQGGSDVVGISGSGVHQKLRKVNFRVFQRSRNTVVVMMQPGSSAHG